MAVPSYRSTRAFSAGAGQVATMASMDEPLVWRVGSRTLDCSAWTLVMGILNVTPDSFSDGGRFFDPEAAVVRGMQMVAEGADLIDVGGESTRPGSEPVPEEQERDRVVPVIKRLAAEVSEPISVDTRKPAVAAAALEVGAVIVNDVTGGADPGMLHVARDAGAGMVLMHMRGDPSMMQQLTDYTDVVAEVKRFLAERVGAAVAAGIDSDQLAVDPGLGFAKTSDQSLRLMRDIDEFLDLGRPVLAGPSRKSFIGHVLGTEVDDRLEGTAGAVAWLVARGAHIVRVHDVKEMVRVVRVVDAIRRGAVEAEPSPSQGE
jgi:dihydropteroate synthase